MVGFIPDPSIEEDPNQESKPHTFKDPVHLLDPKSNDLSIADSFFDFDSIKEWLEDNPTFSFGSEEREFGGIEKIMEVGKEDNLEKTHVVNHIVCKSEPFVDGFESITCASELAGGELGGSDFGGIEKRMEVGKEDNLEKTHVGNPVVCKSEPFVDGFESIICGSELAGGESGCTVKVKVGAEESKSEGKLSSSIEEDIAKVSLTGGVDGVSSSSEESETESSSSPSSSSSSSDDDDDEAEEIKEKVKVEVEVKRGVDGAGELEEGEIEGIDGEMAVGETDNSDEDEREDEPAEFEFDEVDDEDSDDGAIKGPIKSKNELEVLPPVPPVDVTLQPHHHMLPIGAVLSMMGTKVIVEGREQHNPLNEGSILWITADRSPLGLVDEIFGPVKNPYYVVRYNSESELPAGISEGTLISFVPEFANHVLNDKNLFKKGYDASGENDEEFSDAEFSDDEKEAEYKRMQKMMKRGMNEQRVGNKKNNKKNVKGRNGAWKKDWSSSQQNSTAEGQLPCHHNNFSTVSASSSSVVGERSFAGGPVFVPPFSVMPQSSGFTPSNNQVWNNGMHNQQPQNAIFPNMFSSEAMLSMLSPNYQQQPNGLPTPARPMPSMMQYHQMQQMDPGLSALPNVGLPGGQPNLFTGQASAPWLGMGMQMQGQQLLSALQGMLANAPTANGNNNLQHNGNQVKFETPQNFNTGASSSGGRGKKPWHRGRGRGRFNGGRGPRQS